MVGDLYMYRYIQLSSVHGTSPLLSLSLSLTHTHTHAHPPSSIKPSDSVKGRQKGGFFSDEDEEGDLFSTASAAATATPPAQTK